MLTPIAALGEPTVALLSVPDAPMASMASVTAGAACLVAVGALGALLVLSSDEAGQLHRQLWRLPTSAVLGACVLGARLVVQALAQVDTLVREPQPAQGVSYARKVEKADASVDWRSRAAVIERRVRAFDPFPGTHFGCADEQVKLWRAQVRASEPGVTAAPGTVLEAGAQGLVVACGDGVLACLEVQRPGGRRQEAAQWLRSPAGAWLRPGVVLPLPQPSAVPDAPSFKAGPPSTDNPGV